jgi:hypothetical protein
MPMIDGSRYDPPSLSKDCSIINVQLIEIPLAPGIFWMDGRQPEAIHKRGSKRSLVMSSIREPVSALSGPPFDVQPEPH